MSEENTISTAPEISNPAPESTDKPEVVESEATSDAAPEGESTDKPEKTAEQKELEYLRRKATKADRNNARLHMEREHYRQQAERAQQSVPAEQRQTQQFDPVEVERQIERLADERSSLRETNSKANAIAEAGEKRFTNFTDSVNSVAEEAGPLFDNRGRPTSLGEALMDSKDPAALIDFLHKNPSLAADLEGLSPTKLGMRIADLQVQMFTPKNRPASNAPPPIKPLQGGTSGATKALESTATMAEYKAARAKQGARWAR